MPRKKAAKSKRYPPEEKQKIADFVHEANSPSGRGGVTAAVKKFGVSALTISTWLKKSSESAPKAGKGATAKSEGERAKLLSQLASLDREIATKRKELEVVEAKFHKIKTQL